MSDDFMLEDEYRLWMADYDRVVLQHHAEIRPGHFGIEDSGRYLIVDTTRVYMADQAEADRESFLAREGYRVVIVHIPEDVESWGLREAMRYGGRMARIIAAYADDPKADPEDTEKALMAVIDQLPRIPAAVMASA